MADALASETSITTVTSLANPVRLKKDYYYPYPDAVVPFAYKLVQPASLSSSSSSSTTETLVTLGTQLSTAVSKLFPALANSLQQHAQLSALLFPIHPEIPEMLSLYQLIGWVQYLLHRQSSSSSSSSSVSSPWWQRIYLGSPHLFYRSLLSAQNGSLDPTNSSNSTTPRASREDYQLLNREPIYPSGTWSAADLEPLHEDFRLNTMLIWRAPRTLKSSSISPINLLPRYSTTYGGTYCGDDRDNWQLAYEVGKAGTYDTCRELYFAQTNTAGLNIANTSTPINLANRTFQATITLPLQLFQSLPQQSSTAPTISQLVPQLQSFISERQPQNDDYGNASENKGEGVESADIENVIDDERKTLQLDTDAMRWQAGRVGSSLAQAREDYHNAERELLRLQLTPFLRPSTKSAISLPQPPPTSVFLPATNSFTNSLRSS